jgi:hypothetical protein
VTEGLALAETPVGTPVALTFEADRIHLFAPDGRRLAHK